MPRTERRWRKRLELRADRPNLYVVPPIARCADGEPYQIDTGEIPRVELEAAHDANQASAITILLWLLLAGAGGIAAVLGWCVWKLAE